jgi:hypothetical protein
MCATLSGGSERCAITVGKPEGSSIDNLSGNINNYHGNPELDEDLFHIAQELQEQVLLVLPAVPAMFFTLGVIALASHGISNRPFVGFASSAKQYDRNRHLDIIRVAILGLLGLSTVFSFAIAVGASQMYAALQFTAGNDPSSGRGGETFQVNRGTGALALHWLAVTTTLLFFIGLTLCNTKLSMVSFAVAPPDVAGTGATAYDMNSMDGAPLEKASLLHSAAPLNSAPPPSGVTPEAAAPMPRGAGGMNGGMGAMGGARGGMMGARGGAMGARGGMMGARGGAMGARGGMMGARGGAMGMGARGGMAGGR